MQSRLPAVTVLLKDDGTRLQLHVGGDPMIMVVMLRGWGRVVLVIAMVIMVVVEMRTVVMPVVIADNK